MASSTPAPAPTGTVQPLHPPQAASVPFRGGTPAPSMYGPVQAYRAPGYAPGYAPSGNYAPNPGYGPGQGYGPGPGYGPNNGYYRPGPGFTTTRYSNGAPPQSGYGYAGGYRGYRYGYYSRAYVPRYGYGYSYYYGAPAVGVATGVAVVQEPVVEAEGPGVRVSAGVEAAGYFGGSGIAGNFGANVSFEGYRWGFAMTGADIVTPNSDGTYGHMGNATAHVTFAFLSGRYGRMRAELGADGFFSPHEILVGPTGGLSGSMWIGGPFSLEASAMVTPWPFTQVDGRVGFGLGLGPVGLRAGWRVQYLNDRGIADGTVHSAFFNGPYVGLAFVF